MIRQRIAGEWVNLPKRVDKGSLAWKVGVIKIGDWKDGNVMAAHQEWSCAGLAPRWRVIRQAQLTGCSDLSYDD